MGSGSGNAYIIKWMDWTGLDSPLAIYRDAGLDNTTIRQYDNTKQYESGFM